jgi:plastocyanin
MRATSRLAVVLALPLVLTACAERERVVPTDHATPRAVATVPATVFPAPTTLAPTTEAPSAPASGTPTAAPSGGSGETGNAVTAAGVKFTPASLKVKVGTKVTWTTSEYHTVDSGEPGKPDGGPLKAPGGFKTYSYTFDKAGTFKYFCTPHASVGMTGEVVVG